MRIIFTILVCLFVRLLPAQHMVHLRVDSLPPEPKTLDLYIAGSFNGWNPGDEKYMFQRMGNGQFYLDLNLPDGIHEFKITRGSWKETECKADGSDRPNRVLKVTKEETITLNIEAWKDAFAEQNIPHTASKQVRVVDTAFYIPQLKRKRRVLIYLPEDYATSRKRYPVLYMHDGQNLFDQATSFSGEWGVDEYMDTTRAGKCIVVGVDNGGQKRVNEYCPYDFSPDGKTVKDNPGEGQQYVDFLAKTLKPYIDKRYRTKKESRNTFISGSSMGGLISLYAIIRYPDVFGGAGVFSPSVWICKDELLQLIGKRGTKVKGRVYLYCGKKEGPGMVPNTLLTFEKLAAVSKARITTVIRDEGTHNEAVWRKEFPLFYEWIMN